MRVALFSDVHANAVAFEAMLEDLDRQSVDRVVCLGDHVQGGAQPAECFDLVQELGCPVVMGNSDYFVLTLDPGEEAPSEAQKDRVRWSQQQLGEERLAVVGRFEPTVEVDLDDGKTLLAFHATPRSRDEIIEPGTEEEAFRAPFAGLGAAVFAGGHTHQQWARRLGEAYYLNPGSVGLAYDHFQDEESFRVDPYAEYAILTAGDSIGVEFRRVPFDRNEVVQAIESSEMPHPELATRFWL